MTDGNEERREASMRDFMAVIFRRKWIVLASLAAAIGIVILLRALSPTQYESTAQLLVSRGEPESAYTSRLKILPWEEDLNSEIETIRSAHIVQLAQKLLNDAGAKDSKGLPIKAEPSMLSSNTQSKSTVIYLTARNTDPAAAQQIARAVTQAYADFRLNVRSVPELASYFREEIDGLRQQLEEWEQRRAEYMNEESVSGLENERASMIQVRQQIELDLSRVRSELAAQRAKVDMIEGFLSQSPVDSGPIPYTFTENNDDSEMIFQLRRALLTKKAELVGAQAVYQDEYPQVITLQEEVEKLDSLVRKEMEGYARHLRSKVEVARAQEEALLTSLAYADATLSSYPYKQARLASFDRVIEALQTDYRALVDKEIQARLERIGSSGWNVLVLQPASDPRPVRVTDVVRLALIPIIGLIVAIAFAFLVDGLDHSVKDATEAERHLGLPVLGSVGRMR